MLTRWSLTDRTMQVKVNFPLRKNFRGNLNEAISLVEIASFRFPQKSFIKKKLTIRILVETQSKL